MAGSSGLSKRPVKVTRTWNGAEEMIRKIRKIRQIRVSHVLVAS